MPLQDIELWDGRWDWCNGYRDGLPWWKWKTAPSGLATKSQLRKLQLRRRRGQEPYGLLVFWNRGHGEQVAQLFRTDLALPARTRTPALLASVEAMQRACRTCKRCGDEFPNRLPTSTKKCWSCMSKTNDFGERAA